MNKAKYVSDWIKKQKEKRIKNYEIAKILHCSKSSVSNLKYERHKKGELTSIAFDIIQSIEKTDWPTWETVREAEKEMTPKETLMKKQINFILNDITEINGKIEGYTGRLMEYGRRIAKVESLVLYPQTQTGLIRKFWRWLW